MVNRAEYDVEGYGFTSDDRKTRYVYGPEFSLIKGNIVEGELSEFEQNVLSLYYDKHLAIDEIAKALGEDRRNVEHWFREATRKLFTHVKMRETEGRVSPKKKTRKAKDAAKAAIKQLRGKGKLDPPMVGTSYRYSRKLLDDFLNSKQRKGDGTIKSSLTSKWYFFFLFSPCVVEAKKERKNMCS